MFRFSRDSSGVSGACDAVYPLGARAARRVTGVLVRTGGLAALVLALGACDRASVGSPSPRAPAPPLVGPAGAGPRLPAPEPLELTNRSVDSALRALARAAHTTIVVDADASAVASCARISVHAPAPSDPSALVALVATALEAQGLRLEQHPTGLILRRVAGAPMPASCAVPTRPSLPPVSNLDLAAYDARVAQLNDGIRRISDTEILVVRRALDGLLEDQSMLMRQVRVVPHMENGQVDGLRLFGIRASSVVSALGFQNGDTLRRVNGHDVSSPERALDAYAAVRNADRVEVDLDRRGAPLHVVYRVVGRLPPPPRP